MGTGILSLGVGGGLWFGPRANAKSTRDQILKAWLSTESESNYNRLTQHLSDNDADVQS